jgi:hydrogenase nickel incorporation protein HypA/HybF
MDELEIAESVFETLLAEANKLRLPPLAITLSYGAMQQVNKEALCEAFDALCRETICSGARLLIKELPLQIRCQSCDAVSDYDVRAPRCGKCGSEKYNFLPDAPILLEDIEFKEA